MATIRKRERKDGTAIFQVRWLQGGRGGTWESEPFADETGADQFKKLVDAHGQAWPPGWVKGKGFVEPEEIDGDVPLLDYANEYVDHLTGLEPRTRHDYRAMVTRYFPLITHATADKRVVDATVCNLTQADVKRWVRLLDEGLRDPQKPEEWLQKPSHAKSTRNRHALLFCVLQAAVEADPRLRDRNPCVGVRLPRVDSGTQEEMTFLEHDEWQRLRNEFTDHGARDLADFLVGTGLRWGEATALKVQDLTLHTDAPTASIQRAWKRQVDYTFALGPPKTAKSRRMIALSPIQVDMLRRLVTGQPPEAFVFRTVLGNHWRHQNFYNRKWLPAVEEAVSKGLLKRPRIHDLRHTHVAWLIGAKVPLPAIQGRLGHQSISTTVDRYGHLVRTLDAEITAAVEAAMGGAPAPVASGLRAVASA